MFLKFSVRMTKYKFNKVFEYSSLLHIPIGVMDSTCDFKSYPPGSIPGYSYKNCWIGLVSVCPIVSVYISFNKVFLKFPLRMTKFKLKKLIEDCIIAKHPDWCNG